MVQLDLFGTTLRAEKYSRVYQAVDHLREKYGKHTVFLGSSFPAQKFAQHLGERGDESLRKQLGLPLFMGQLVEDIHGHQAESD